MAKFSISRDEEEDNEEFCTRSPKRSRNSDSQNSSIFHSSSDDEENLHSQQQPDDDDGGNSDSTSGPNKRARKKAVYLSEPDVLDCPICFEPLFTPIFQCNNGHLVCSSCRTLVNNKCPMCSGKIGDNRCRAIEKVVESFYVNCSYKGYGCTKLVNYSRRHRHEEKCTYAPCSCPFPNCHFRGSPMMLSHHVSKEHLGSVIRFCYNTTFIVSVAMADKVVVLQEERDGNLFILSHGSMVAVRCIDPSPSNGRFKYEIVVHSGDNSLYYEAHTRCVTQRFSDPPDEDYTIVPGYFYPTNGCLKLQIRIISKDANVANQANISEPVNGT